MDNTYETRIKRLVDAGQQELLRDGLKGIEKESLRITRDGSIAQTPHPAALGSALTHPYITTDYSEALLEFRTPPFRHIEETLDFLERIHRFVYAHLGNELLLATSMPCGIAGDESIPIANYGRSNIGLMKHIYRRGLSYRYGRAMQAIAGVHFNYSVPEAFWPVFKELDDNAKSLSTFISDSYFALVRNLHRFGWLVLYLFGASPAICKSFLRDRKEQWSRFESLDPYTLYTPYATSLRMSDIGYNSKNQSALHISLNSLSAYVESLRAAIETPHPEYVRIGVKKNGEYRQLSDGILQIENEYYSTVRPKQIAKSGEKPTSALKRRGVRYVELRSVDIDVFSPLGVQIDHLRFLEALMLFCLLSESPPSDARENEAVKENVKRVAYRGRDPQLELRRHGAQISARQWALDLCESMHPICAILDGGTSDNAYSRALSDQVDTIRNPDATPSARMLSEMKRRGETFADFALRISDEYEHDFRSHRLDPETEQHFRIQAEASIRRQIEMEANDTLPFDAFLQHYFAQS